MVTVREIAESELGALLSLNNQAVPAVSELDSNALAHLLGQAEWSRLVQQLDQILGFILALGPGADYQSPNYQWISRHYSDFLYVDRVVIAPQAQAMGLGRRLYKGLQNCRGAKPTRITCEVNIHPPNPRSMAFHQRLGFVEVGQADTDQGTKRVAYLCREPEQ